MTYVPVLQIGIDDPQVSDTPEVALPASEYAVTVYLTDGTVYAANVSVKDQEVTVVNPVSRPGPLERVVESAWNYVVPLGEGRFLTYDSGSAPEVGTSGEAVLEPFFSYNELWSACPARDGRVLLFGDAGPGVYDPATRKVTPFESDEIELSFLTADTLQAARCVTGATQFSFDPGLARVSPAGVQFLDLNLPPEPGYLASGTGYLDSSSPGYLADAVTGIRAAITGNDHYESAGHRIAPADLKPSRLILSRGPDEHRYVDLGHRDDILGVQLAPDGSKVAVQTDNLIGVYDTTTTDLLYTTPAWWDRFFWIDDNRFIYFGEPDTHSVFVADVAHRESWGLNRTDEVSPSSLTGYFDGYLYLTGADQAELDETGFADRRGYRVPLR